MAKAMVDFMSWALTDGQKYAADLGYAPLPAEVVKMEMAALKKIKTQ
jgi:phosphate transport system substrate-binding protein